MNSTLADYLLFRVTANTDSTALGENSRMYINYHCGAGSEQKGYRPTNLAGGVAEETCTPNQPAATTSLGARNTKLETGSSSQTLSSGLVAADQTHFFGYAMHCTDDFFGYAPHCTDHFFGYATHCTIEEETDFDQAYEAFITAMEAPRASSDAPTAKFDFQYMFDTAALSVLLLVAAFVLYRFVSSKRSGRRALSASVAIYLLCVFPVVAKAAGPAHNVTATCKSICCNLASCNSTFPKTCSTPCCSSYISQPSDCATCLTAHGCTPAPTPVPPGPAPPKPGHSSQCALLCEMYHSTFRGDGWIASCSKAGWAEGCPLPAVSTTACCGWYGITCNGNGDVTKIALGGCNLLGMLTANAAGQSVFSLPAMEEFGVPNGGDGAKCTAEGYHRRSANRPEKCIGASEHWTLLQLVHWHS
jgi:hypothetical protein